MGDSPAANKHLNIWRHALGRARRPADSSGIHFGVCALIPGHIDNQTAGEFPDDLPRGIYPVRARSAATDTTSSAQKAFVLSGGSCIGGGGTGAYRINPSWQIVGEFT